MSTYSPVSTFVADACRTSSPPAARRTFSITTEPSRPALAASFLRRLSSARRTMLDAGRGVTLELDAVERLLGVQQRHAATGNDAFFEGRAGGRQRVLDAVLLLFELDLGAGADLDDGHAAGQLGQALLELLAVVVAGGLLDLRLDLIDAALDRGRRRPCPRRWSCRPCWQRPGAPTPRSSSSTDSSLRPISSLMTVPPVRMAMSRSISLRRSPKPGALTASDVDDAAQLVHAPAWPAPRRRRPRR